jgi:hypothetical protein
MLSGVAIPPIPPGPEQPQSEPARARPRTERLLSRGEIAVLVVVAVLLVVVVCGAVLILAAMGNQS